MNVEPTEIPGVVIVEPDVFRDPRGYFLETFHRARYRDLGVGHDGAATSDDGFAQLNHSHSVHRTLRGLHFQEPHGQAKLVWVVSGRVYDVAVDVRRGSPSFGKWLGAELSAENHRQLWLPAGIAHGFCVLSDQADFMYACTEVYRQQCEHTLRWDDPAVGVDWPIDAPILSDKDASAPPLSELDALPSFPA